MHVGAQQRVQRCPSRRWRQVRGRLLVGRRIVSAAHHADGCCRLFDQFCHSSGSVSRLLVPSRAQSHDDFVQLASFLLLALRGLLLLTLHQFVQHVVQLALLAFARQAEVLGGVATLVASTTRHVECARRRTFHFRKAETVGSTGVSTHYLFKLSKYLP